VSFLKSTPNPTPLKYRWGLRLVFKCTYSCKTIYQENYQYVQ
jgi:hypothetical protein